MNTVLLKPIENALPVILLLLYYFTSRIDLEIVRSLTIICRARDISIEMPVSRVFCGPLLGYCMTAKFCMRQALHCNRGLSQEVNWDGTRLLTERGTQPTGSRSRTQYFRHEYTSRNYQGFYVTELDLASWVFNGLYSGF